MGLDDAEHVPRSLNTRFQAAKAHNKFTSDNMWIPKAWSKLLHACFELLQTLLLLTCLLPPQELRISREWDVFQHPDWLVFEAEQQLAIRPLQFKVAAQLMTSPGAISQLNMGEGKTRVILPMLLLHWADGQTLVRAAKGGMLSLLHDCAWHALSACKHAL